MKRLINYPKMLLVKIIQKVVQQNVVTCAPINCKLPFKGTKEYRKHIEETHKVEDGYKCDQCLKVKSTRQLWMHHCVVHHCVVHHREKERVAKTKPVIHDATIQKEKLFFVTFAM